MQRYERQLVYDIKYAISAIIVLTIFALTLVAAVFYASTKFSRSRLSRLLNQTSTGRIVTNLLYPDVCDSEASTTDWLTQAGQTRLAYPFVNTTATHDGNTTKETEGSHTSTPAVEESVAITGGSGDNDATPNHEVQPSDDEFDEAIESPSHNEISPLQKDTKKNPSDKID